MKIVEMSQCGVSMFFIAVGWTAAASAGLDPLSLPGSCLPGCCRRSPTYGYGRLRLSDAGGGVGRKRRAFLAHIGEMCIFAPKKTTMNDIAAELAKLHVLKGADYSRQVERIARMDNFHPVENETGIFSVGGEGGDDYDNLLNAARKAVTHGYKVFILPNPSGTRTPDFIFERKGTYRPYDLKTISGKASASNRLEESIDQSNRVLLNIVTDYSPSSLARSIKHYFEYNNDAIEVLVYKGGKSISVSREMSQSRSFYSLFMKKYSK